MPARERTVGQVALLTGLTVRALHHYDAIGLVSPSLRSAAGYRLYTEADLQRLQQVLLFRELGFGLDAVRDLLDAPAERRRDALPAQRKALEQQCRHADAVLHAVDVHRRCALPGPLRQTCRWPGRLYRSGSTRKCAEACDRWRMSLHFA